MKSILALILPDNESKTISRRYLKAGRKAIGFQDKQLVVANPEGIEQGIQCITGDDIGSNITTDAQTVTKRVTVLSGRTGATVLNIPAPTGELRELIIINGNTSSGAATVTAAGSTIISAAAVTPGTTATVAIATTARFLSNGTYWYRVA